MFKDKNNDDEEKGVFMKFTPLVAEVLAIENICRNISKLKFELSFLERVQFILNLRIPKLKYRKYDTATITAVKSFIVQAQISSS